jgi:hypothetical protein
MSEIGFAAPGFLAPGFLPAGLAALQFEQPVRLASAAWHSDGLDLPADTLWPPRILGDVAVAQDALGVLAGGGLVALTAAEIDVADLDDWAADLARYRVADGRAAEIRIAPVLDARASDWGTPLRNTTRMFAGTLARVTRQPRRRARLALTDTTTRLDVPLQGLRYAGTGGLQGPAALADRPQPVCLGRVFNVPAVELGNVDLGDGALPTFQVHWRAVAGIDAIRIRGVEQTIIGTAPGVGQARAWASLGLFQIGSTPDGRVTADVRGDADGYPNTTGTVLWRLLTSLGPLFAEADRDVTSWLFAEVDLPGEVGFWQGAEDIRARDAVARLLAGAGAVLAGDRDGKLRLFDPFRPAAALQFDAPAEWVVSEPEPATLPDDLTAAAAVEVEWGRNLAPLGDLPTGAPAALRQRLADAAPPVALYSSGLQRQRLAVPRTLRLPGLYADLPSAQARAEVIGAWIEGGGQALRVTLDRYLGVLNLGDAGRITYPGYGAGAGVSGIVAGWRESATARRVEITLLTTEV